MLNPDDARSSPPFPLGMDGKRRGMPGVVRDLRRSAPLADRAGDWYCLSHPDGS